MLDVLFPEQDERGYQKQCRHRGMYPVYREHLLPTAKQISKLLAGCHNEDRFE